jgi:tellurite resistance protein TehA-like permease
MELELYALNDITRNLLVLVVISFVMYYAGTKSASDKTWIERRFASFFTFSLLVWLSLTFFIPFTVMSFSYPNLVLEIGVRILNDLRYAIILVVVFVIIIQVLNYRGHIRNDK